MKATLLTTCIALLSASVTWAQNGFFRNGAVGGVAIDVNGVLSEPTERATRHLAAMMREQVPMAADEMNEATELRRVSLRGLAEAVRNATKNQEDLPAECRYLAGLQRVKYVFVYPDSGDVVAA